MSAERELIGYRVRLPNVGGGWRYLVAATYGIGGTLSTKEDAQLFISRRRALKVMADLGGVWALDGRIVHVYRRKK